MVRDRSKTVVWRTQILHRGQCCVNTDAERLALPRLCRYYLQVATNRTGKNNAADRTAVHILHAAIAGTQPQNAGARCEREHQLINRAPPQITHSTYWLKRQPHQTSSCCTLTQWRSGSKKTKPPHQHLTRNYRAWQH